MPVLSAENPHTSCTNRVRKKKTLISAVPTPSIIR